MTQPDPRATARAQTHLRFWNALVFFITLGLVVMLTACAGNQPRINLDTREFDFGNVTNGETVSREVAVRNTGQDDLVVETVTTTCSCTSATLERMTIPPGGKAILRIDFDSGTHGPELKGQVMRQVIIISNDPENPEVTVQFIANVLPLETP